MATTTDDEVLDNLPDQKIPFLENGDHLTLTEFLRRYEAMPESTKAELIDGRVYMSAAAVRFEHHGRPHGNLLGWLYVYETCTPHTASAGECSVLVNTESAPQPDATLLILPEAGGQAKITEKDYLEGAPELVCEVSASSVSYDLHEKLQVYRRSGVREYLVWKVLEKAIVWHRLENEEYIPIVPDEQGVLCSRVFPGLWLDVPALLGNESAKVLATLQRGLQTEEHRQFVRQLQEAVTKHKT